MCTCIIPSSALSCPSQLNCGSILRYLSYLFLHLPGSFYCLAVLRGDKLCATWVLPRERSEWPTRGERLECAPRVVGEIRHGSFLFYNALARLEHNTLPVGKVWRSLLILYQRHAARTLFVSLPI